MSEMAIIWIMRHIHIHMKSVRLISPGNRRGGEGKQLQGGGTQCHISRLIYS